VRSARGQVVDLLLRGLDGRGLPGGARLVEVARSRDAAESTHRVVERPVRPVPVVPPFVDGLAFAHLRLPVRHQGRQHGLAGEAPELHLGPRGQETPGFGDRLVLAATSTRHRLDVVVHHRADTIAVVEGSSDVADTEAGLAERHDEHGLLHLVVGVRAVPGLLVDGLRHEEALGVVEAQRLRRQPAHVAELAAELADGEEHGPQRAASSSDKVK
jgi:hypothetical protein